jgi:hypothetical protein
MISERLNVRPTSGIYNGPILADNEVFVKSELEHLGHKLVRADTQEPQRFLDNI